MRSRVTLPGPWRKDAWPDDPLTKDLPLSTTYPNCWRKTEAALWVAVGLLSNAPNFCRQIPKSKRRATTSVCPGGLMLFVAIETDEGAKDRSKNHASHANESPEMKPTPLAVFHVRRSNRSRLVHSISHLLCGDAESAGARDIANAAIQADDQNLLRWQSPTLLIADCCALRVIFMTGK